MAIAWTLVSNPDVIVADEPTAALDKVSGLAAVRPFKDLGRARATSTVLVTHDPQILDLADRVVTLEDARIVKDMAGPRFQAPAVSANAAECSRKGWFARMGHGAPNTYATLTKNAPRAPSRQTHE